MKKTNLIKWIIFIVLSFCLITIISCHSDKYNQDVTVKEIINTSDLIGMEIVIIDSCEYIQFITAEQNRSITHKGNCKYCVQRTKSAYK